MILISAGVALVFLAGFALGRWARDRPSLPRRSPPDYVPVALEHFDHIPTEDAP